MKKFKNGIALKALDDEGHGLARIATLSAVDHDGDTYAKGAFGGESGEQWAAVLAAHNWGTVPLGKARVFESGDEALAEFHLNLNSAAGKEWHSALKFDLDGCDGTGSHQPVQEWSYGFRVLDAGYEEREGERIRVLKKLKVFEISPVVQGAGINTGTLVMKGATLKDEHFERLTGDIAEMLTSIRADPTALSAAGLKQIASLHDGMRSVLDAAEAEEASARRLMAGQAFRAARRHLQV
ncbi:MAG: HK97 family phage prohead protease [Rhizobiaceae bacterium]|nr:HK97 family phage prohead protease [Rhizobiaceae bacterium]